MSVVVAIVSSSQDGFRIVIDGDEPILIPNAAVLAESYARSLIARKQLQEKIDGIKECLGAYAPSGNNINWESNFNGLKTDIGVVLRDEVVF